MRLRCSDFSHLLYQISFSEDICQAFFTIDCYIMLDADAAYLCACVIRYLQIVCCRVCACLSGLRVLKGENNKQRSQTVILHKHPISFFFFPLLIKCDSVVLQETTHGLSHWIQRPGMWHECVCGVLVRDGHLSHNNVSHIHKDQQVPCLSAVLPLPSLSLSLHFCAFIYPKKKNFYQIESIRPSICPTTCPSISCFPKFHINWFLCVCAEK